MELIAILFLISIASNLAGGDQKVTLGKVLSKYEENLQTIIDTRDKIKNFHPFLEKVWPVAILEDDSFYVFDVDSLSKRFTLVKQTAAPKSIRRGVRAALPLDCYGWRMACVVSGEIFGSSEGYATIFHEFIHCCQNETCEKKIKNTLEIARKAVARKDYMWELNHPFPYVDREFEEAYSLFLRSLEDDDSERILKYRKRLKQILAKGDFEYMVWQEWKEGFARLIENKVRRRLGLEENHSGRGKPFSRVSFYEGGARFIEYLGKQDQDLLKDIEKLFYKMLE